MSSGFEHHTRHMGQAKFCLWVCPVAFTGVLPFQCQLLIGPSHTNEIILKGCKTEKNIIDIYHCCCCYMSRFMRKPTMWFPNRSDTNWTVLSQKMARSLKFQIYVEEELYYPCSKCKGADQLCSYCETDLHLCFRI